jgi:hemerythrin
MMQGADFEQDHQALFALLDRLGVALRARVGKAGLVALFEQLLDFARLHFLSEETLMLQAQFPGGARHCEQHAQLLAQITEILLELRASVDRAPADAASLMHRWLNSHIEDADKEFYQYLKEQHD